MQKFGIIVFDFGEKLIFRFFLAGTKFPGNGSSGWMLYRCKTQENNKKSLFFIYVLDHGTKC